MSAGPWFVEAEPITKHQGRIDKDEHKAVCSCKHRFKVREIYLDAINDLMAHYEKKGTLYRYMSKPHYKERVAA